jgi:hypothetical protein
MHAHHHICPSLSPSIQRTNFSLNVPSSSELASRDLRRLYATLTLNEAKNGNFGCNGISQSSESDRQSAPHQETPALPSLETGVLVALHVALAPWTSLFCFSFFAHPLQRDFSLLGHTVSIRCSSPRKRLGGRDGDGGGRGVTRGFGKLRCCKTDGGTDDQPTSTN